METFNMLVGEQLKTMDRLLELQSELERCQEIQREVTHFQDEATKLSIQKEVEQTKKELSAIQEIFEKQTEDVIRSYQDPHAKVR
ncbi:YgaB family protein [Metabacillus sp. RGM 3146]|uniref:YgaB family protein n=1 Tax=Metabacillus sp. RGM 3146 TaxID=3401092 RepID=UPI003B99CE2B